MVVAAGLDGHFPATIGEWEPVGAAAAGGKCDFRRDCSSEVWRALPRVVGHCAL